MTMHYSRDLKDIDDLLTEQRRRENRLRRALQRILSAAEGDPRFVPMNWSDVAEVARRALSEADLAAAPHSAPRLPGHANGR